MVAKKLLEDGDRHLVNTGISPSGYFHIGHMREILTGDAIHRSVVKMGGKSRLNYIADSFDALRKVPSAVPESYSEYIGMPLIDIPCPCGSHDSFAEHFLEPFLKTTDALGIEMDLVHSWQLYLDSGLEEEIRKAIEKRGEVREILMRISGRDLPEDFFPYEPLCKKCGKFSKGERFFDDPFVDFTCSCGAQGRADIRTNDGKLPWRVEWPAKWSKLKVTCEPFGKDHASAGGSYDSGAVICHDIFGRKPPEPLVYEWIQLKGVGAMSSSKGIVATAHEIAEVVPPEVMRFLIMKPQPERHLDFDPGMGLIKLSDDFDKLERGYFGLEDYDVEEKRKDWDRTYELSLLGDPPRSMPFQVPFGHIVNLYQISRNKEGVIKRVERLKGDELTDGEKADVERRLACAKNWIEMGLAPKNVLFSLNEKPEALETDRRFVEEFVFSLRKIEWTDENIHNAVYDTAERMEENAGKVFRAIYRTLLGKKFGPKLGMFLASFEKDEVLAMLERSLE